MMDPADFDWGVTAEEAPPCGDTPCAEADCWHRMTGTCERI